MICHQRSGGVSSNERESRLGPTAEIVGGVGGRGHSGERNEQRELHRRRRRYVCTLKDVLRLVQPKDVVDRRKSNRLLAQPVDVITTPIRSSLLMDLDGSDTDERLPTRRSRGACLMRARLWAGLYVHFFVEKPFSLDFVVFTDGQEARNRTHIRSFRFIWSSVLHPGMQTRELPRLDGVAKMILRNGMVNELYR